jgi:hypothetical protein
MSITGSSWFDFPDGAHAPGDLDSLLSFRQGRRGLFRRNGLAARLSGRAQRGLRAGTRESSFSPYRDFLFITGAGYL